MSTPRPLTKINRELKAYKNLRGPGMFLGVCAGIAYRFGLPTWIVRIAFMAALFGYGVGLLAYLLVGFLAPSADTPLDYGKRTGGA